MQVREAITFPEKVAVDAGDDGDPKLSSESVSSTKDANSDDGQQISASRNPRTWPNVRP